jgi:phosphoserine aminotransferase
MTTAPSTAASAAGTGHRIFNFSAGPATLPEEVLRQAQGDLWSIRDSGVGILEHSHRGKVFSAVIEEAEAECRAVAGIGDDHAVLFLQGGATLQFAMVPMNFLLEGRVADYANTGAWATKAIKEAKKFGQVNTAFDGSQSRFDHTPDDGELTRTGGAVYFHYCSNNTLYGTCWPTPPSTPGPLVSDMSSDIFSRPVDVDRHALIYAGAQKNLGPAGCTLVIIRRDFMETGRENLPLMLDYRKQAAKGSCLNTPPCFAIYFMGEVFKWIRGQGGLETLAGLNRDKAQVIYDAIERSGGFYSAVARADCRSMMNVTFRTPGDDLDKSFIEEARRHDMDGLKGHRDVGGLRASIYNAFPRKGCQMLAEFMDEFARQKG